MTRTYTIGRKAQGGIGTSEAEAKYQTYYSTATPEGYISGIGYRVSISNDYSYLNSQQRNP